MKLLRLQEWAAQRYGEKAPCLATLRRWARDARIYPVPQKHGRTYFVQPDAEYQDAEAERYGSPRKKPLKAELAGSPSRA